jgi:hypothetical protein
VPVDGRWPSDEVEATVIASGVAIRLRNPSHPLLAAWATRGASLMRRLKPATARLASALLLLARTDRRWFTSRPWQDSLQAPSIECRPIRKH